MEKVNEFEETLNEHARQQAESFQSFYMRGQDRAREMISKTMETIGDHMAEPREDAVTSDKE